MEMDYPFPTVEGERNYEGPVVLSLLTPAEIARL